MKTLRASGTRLQADVVIGSNQYGSDVAVHLTLDRKDPEVIEALDPLDALLRRRAFALVQESSDNLEIQRRVAEKVAAERDRIKRHAVATTQHEVQKTKVLPLESQVRMLEAELARLKRENERRQPGPEVVEG